MWALLLNLGRKVRGFWRKVINEIQEIGKTKIKQNE